MSLKIDVYSRCCLRAPRQALTFLDTVAMLDASSTYSETFVKTVAAAMRANADSAIIQTAGLRVLSRVAHAEETAHLLIRDGAIHQTLQAIAQHDEAASLQQAALELLATLCQTDAGVVETAKQSGFNVIVDVIYARPENDEVQRGV